jgi:DNA-damage-inducible protein J
MQDLDDRDRLVLTTRQDVATLTPHYMDAVLRRNAMLTTTLKTTDVRSRIEPDLKDRAAEVLAECGLNLSDAIRLFLRQVVAQQGLPFEIRTPNATTIAAMKEARAMGKAKFDSAQALFNDLEKAAPEKARKPAKKQR